MVQWVRYSSRVPFILITDKRPGDLLDYTLHQGRFFLGSVVGLNISAYIDWVISMLNGGGNMMCILRQHLALKDRGRHMPHRVPPIALINFLGSYLGPETKNIEGSRCMMM